MDPMFLAGKGESPWTVLALYGHARRGKAVSDLFAVADTIIRRVGFAVNVLGVSTSRGYGRYRRVVPQLLNSLRRDDVTGFSAAYVPSGETDAANLAWIKAGTFDSAFVIDGHTSVLHPNAEGVIHLVKEVAGTYAIRYGYHYVIDKYYGPSLHAVGTFTYHAFRRDLPDLTQVEKNRTSQWCNTFKTALQNGALRDIFPLNVLTEVHERRVIHGVPLFDWIREDVSRGRLERITPTLWAWHVPEERCVDLGDTLEAAGLLA